MAWVGRARREDGGDAQRLERRRVLVRDDAAAEQDHVARTARRQRRQTAGKCVMCAPDMIERPTASTDSCAAAAATISGVWCSPL